jgi:hypothetical protein
VSSEMRNFKTWQRLWLVQARERLACESGVEGKKFHVMGVGLGLFGNMCLFVGGTPFQMGLRGSRQGRVVGEEGVYLVLPRYIERASGWRGRKCVKVGR